LALAMVATAAVSQCRTSAPDSEDRFATQGGTAGSAASATPDAGASLDAGVARVEPAREDGLLPSLAAPTEYALTLEVNPEVETFRGTIRAKLRIPRPTLVLVMHARELEVRAVTALDAAGARIAQGRATPRASAHGRGTPEELVLEFDRELSGDGTTVQLEFVGRFNPALRGLYRVQQQGRWYAFTQFEPNDARRAFPCFDEPEFKVPWTIELVVPQGAVALANMPERSRSQPAGGSVRVQFERTPPTSSYLVALAVGPFDVVDHAPVVLNQGGERVSVPLRGVATHGQGALLRESLDIAAAHLDVLSTYFGRNYPFPKLDLVAVPEFGAGAMENPGLVTFREEMLLLDSQRATTSARRGVAGIIAHELAHQWFGNLVTMRWWDDLWLNEGFATWMASRVLDTWRPEMGARVESVRSRAWAMDQDSLPAARVVRQPVRSTSDAEEAFDGITYTKGAAFLRMIEAAMGEAVFRQGIRSYINAHAWGNAAARDLFDDLQTAGGINVARVAESFLDRRGVPMVSATIQCAAGREPVIHLEQTQYLPLGVGAVSAGSAPVWTIPMCLEYGDDRGPSGRRCVVFSGQSMDVGAPPSEEARLRIGSESDNNRNPNAGIRAPTSAPCPTWVHPNAGESSYVRYALTPPVRALFAQPRWRELDRAMRVGLVDAAWAQVRSGTLPVNEYLTLVGSILDERDRVVLDSISSALATLVSKHSSGPVRERLRAFVARVFRPTLTRLGWTPRPNDTEDDKLLRRSAISVLGSVAHDAEVLRECERYAAQYLRDPASVPVDLALLVLPIASMRADAARFDALLARLRATGLTPQERSAVQSALVTSLDATLLRRGLDALLTDVVRQQDVLRLLWTAAAHPDRRAVAHRWIREHYDGVARRTTEEVAVRLAGIIGDTCSAQDRDEWVSFWRPRAANTEGAERAISEGEDSSRQCEAFGRVVQPALVQWR
jgi:alanyl aminopeptidase